MSLIPVLPVVLPVRVSRETPLLVPKESSDSGFLSSSSPLSVAYDLHYDHKDDTLFVVKTERFSAETRPKSAQNAGKRVTFREDTVDILEVVAPEPIEGWDEEEDDDGSVIALTPFALLVIISLSFLMTLATLLALRLSSADFG
ncbi:unnamed protein product [Oppiella nova]|uniref:Uncharacterized protein n=1 Tax=Oppiella nova TaxID=334625 RepID=A0A7R9QUP8_9ACAR|nr:unnamed protein product [Oppiella nova]CAG2175040.1 unnamed protein product [Oppiella nova]